MKDENLLFVFDNTFGVESLPKGRDNHPGIVQPHLHEECSIRFHQEKPIRIKAHLVIFFSHLGGVKVDSFLSQFVAELIQVEVDQGVHLRQGFLL